MVIAGMLSNKYTNYVSYVHFFCLFKYLRWYWCFEKKIYFIQVVIITANTTVLQGVVILYWKIYEWLALISLMMNERRINAATVEDIQ